LVSAVSADELDLLQFVDDRFSCFLVLSTRRYC
jgi:hypothetical protein